MFKFYRASSIHDALELGEKLEKCVFYAGGTDLIPALRVNAIDPQNIVYIGSITELRCLRKEGKFIHIGALVPHAMVASSSLVRTHIPSLAQACASIGSPQLRNLGTIGGNLCWASPAADTAPVLLAHDARLRLLSNHGEREVPIDQFFLGPNKNLLQPGELLVGIIIPKPEGFSAGTFIKIGRRKALAISVVNCAVLLTKGGLQARIALGSVAPVAFRALQAEKKWRQTWSTGNTELALLVGRVARGETQPISDNRASAWYRRHVAGVVVERALIRCLMELR